MFFKELILKDIEDKNYQYLIPLEYVKPDIVKFERRFNDPCENCVNKGKPCSCPLPATYNPIWCVK